MTSHLIDAIFNLQHSDSFETLRERPVLTPGRGLCGAAPRRHMPCGAVAREALPCGAKPCRHTPRGARAVRGCAVRGCGARGCAVRGCAVRDGAAWGCAAVRGCAVRVVPCMLRLHVVVVPPLAQPHPPLPFRHPREAPTAAEGLVQTESNFWQVVY